MKQKTAAIKFLRTKIAAGYVLILILIFSIVYIWFKEHHKLEEMKEASHKISCLRQNIHDIYVRAVDLSLIGETILNWDDEDIELYHTKRLEVDTLLYQFSSVYPSECIDSICLLLAEKEKLLYGIMLVLNEQEEIKDKIARRVPVIARKSSQEEPPKRKRTGFLGLFGKKEEAKPTVTTSMLNTLNSDVIARRKIMLTVTHELRTPLTAINGYGELLAQTENENKRIEYTQNIRQAAGRMTDMLNTLLNFFRLDSGKEQANAVPFRLKNVIEILQTEFEPRAEAKDLTLRITRCSDIILMGDRNRLVQIGNNLLSNAIKFTESGTVGLDIRRLYQRALQERER
ncbi:HAMP domain-containing sensor histidine kinase [Phocaeicola plebeius]|uniref:sensor histidine kinase n=1 Tax=Phocaeicola plebeius TaxID=310297 RepID=UPI0026EFBB29|nr:HAMP domain-containing sensor histidine kinase [Phocaeicola plebeius]